MTPTDRTRYDVTWDGCPPEELPLTRLWGIAARLTNTGWHRFLEGHGLTGAGFGVLMALDREDGQTSREVAESTWCTPATLTGVVDTLERDGHVERRRGKADRRVVRLYLTDIGRERLADIRRVMDQRSAMMFDFLAPEDEPAVRRFLLGLIARFGPAEPSQPDGGRTR